MGSPTSHPSSNSPDHQHRQYTSQTELPKLSLPATTNPPSASKPPSPKVWLIFGATGHMGRSLAKMVLSKNDSVCAVGRTNETTLPCMQKIFQPNPTAQPTTDKYLGLLCDIRVRETVKSTIDACLKHFGSIDVIANCTGYGVIGACEDQDEFEIRNQFETNFMGTLHILQLSLPHFRERQEGRYLIFSSTSGALGVPGLGPYCATKYAVEGLIESMLYEVDSWNIKPTLVEPGHVRRDDVHPPMSSPVLHTTSLAGTALPTGQAAGARVSAIFGGQSLNLTPSPLTRPIKKESPQPRPATQDAVKETEVPAIPLFSHFRVLRPSAPYATHDAPAAHAKRILQWIGSNQPVSVVKAAELCWQLGHCDYPPLRLLLGTYAVESVRDRLKSVIEEIEDWRFLHFPGLEELENEDDRDEEEGDVEGEGDERDEDHDRDGKGAEMVGNNDKDDDVEMND